MSGESLRALVARLVDEGKAYAIAELAVAKALVRTWLTLAQIVVPLAIVAALLLQAALVTLVVALGLALAHWLGMAGGLAVAAVIALGIVAILVGIVIAKVRKAIK